MWLIGSAENPEETNYAARNVAHNGEGKRVAFPMLLPC